MKTLAAFVFTVFFIQAFAYQFEGSRGPADVACFSSFTVIVLPLHLNILPDRLLSLAPSKVGSRVWLRTCFVCRVHEVDSLLLFPFAFQMWSMSKNMRHSRSTSYADFDFLDLTEFFLVRVFFSEVSLIVGLKWSFQFCLKIRRLYLR